MLVEARRLADQANTRTIPPAWCGSPAQAKTGDVAGAIKSIAKIAVSNREETDQFRRQMTMNIKVEKALALADLAVRRRPRRR